MKPSEVIEPKIDKLRDVFAKFPVKNILIFGSVARGDDNDESDLGILFDTMDETTLFNLGGLHAELEKLLNIKVDLKTPNEISNRFRNEVLEEARSLFQNAA